MKPCNLSADALYTVLLHAAKHPTSAVSGLLLGAVSGEAVEVAQALPVCHSFITLTPLLEAAMVQVRGAGHRATGWGCYCWGNGGSRHHAAPQLPTAALAQPALLQAEQYAKEQQSAHPGLRLVGYYQCNERLADGELGAGRRVADRLEAACPDAVALVVRGAAGVAEDGKVCACTTGCAASDGSVQLLLACLPAPTSVTMQRWSFSFSPQKTDPTGSCAVHKLSSPVHTTLLCSWTVQHWRQL